MSNSVGVLTKMGVGAIAAWNPAYSAVTIPVPLVSENIVANWQRFDWQSLVGAAGKQASLQGPLVVRGDTVHDLDYFNFGAMLKAAMGYNSTSIYTLTDQLNATGNYLRMEFDKGVSRWRVPTTKIDRMVIEGKANEPLKITFGHICVNLSRSATAHPTLSYTGTTRVRFRDISGGFLVGDLSDALSGSDVQPVQEFRLTLERNLVDPDHDSNSPTYCLEPDINGFRTVGLELTLSRYSADTWADWMDNDTALQAEVSFAITDHMFQLDIPQMYITDAPHPVDNPGIIRPKITLACYRNTDNSAMSTISEEFKIIYY